MLAHLATDERRNHEDPQVGGGSTPPWKEATRRRAVCDMSAATP
jgi:hypothetical protein